MVSSSADDEGEQVNAARFFSLSFLILFFSSCSSPSKPAQPLAALVKPTVYAPVVKQKSTVPPVKKKKTIYITFDDGPNKGTRHVLQVIHEEEVPASFFVVGEHVFGSREQQQTWDSLTQCPWVEIYNHSFTHAQHNRFAKFYTSDSAVVADFEQCNDSLKLQTKIARTPGRNIWRTPTIHATDLVKSKPAADSLFNAGFTVVGWDLEWHYNDSMRLQQTPAELIKQVDSVVTNNKTKTPGHIVLLTHDQIFTDSASIVSLKQLIRHYKANEEYQIEFVSRYPGIKQ
jgi:peptidoglycan/xylan/chitin deacetylase (PgdA/CDA1 family)